MSNFIQRKFEEFKTLGEILKEARNKKGVSIEEAEEETKVRVKYLEALEEGRYELLPGNVYALGFLTKYADYLELDKEKLAQQFKIERGDEGSVAKALMLERKIKEPLFSITPKLFIIAAVILGLLGILGYITYSVKAFTSPPNLEISSPSAEQILKEESVEIIGKTDEGVTLLINNQSVSVDVAGNFNQQVKLHSGLNTFEVRAINRLKKETVKQIKILAEF